MSALRTAMTPDAKLAGWLVAQAQAAVKTAKLEWKESLDFSEDSLDAVERIMGKLHARSKRGARERAHRRADSPRRRRCGALCGRSDSAPLRRPMVDVGGRRPATRARRLYGTADRQGPQAHRQRTGGQHQVLLRGDR